MQHPMSATITSNFSILRKPTTIVPCTRTVLDTVASRKPDRGATDVWEHFSIVLGISPDSHQSGGTYLPLLDVTVLGNR